MQLQTTYKQKASRHHLKKDNGGSGSTILAYKPIILSVSTNSSFGAPLEDQSTNWSNESYRYGFNGMEKDDEMKGAGNSYDFGARIYDPRLGRFLSVDPMSNELEWFSPYLFAANIPIAHKDINGMKPFFSAGSNPIIMWKIGQIYIRVDKRLHGLKAFPFYIKIYRNYKNGGGKADPIKPNKEPQKPGEDDDKDEKPIKKVHYTHITKTIVETKRVYMYNESFTNKNIEETFMNDMDPDTPPMVVKFEPHSIANKITITDQDGNVIYETNGKTTDDVIVEIPKNVQSFTVKVNYEKSCSSDFDTYRLRVYQMQKVQTTINKERRFGIRKNKSKEKEPVDWNTPEGKTKEKTKVTKDKGA